MYLKLYERRQSQSQSCIRKTKKISSVECFSTQNHWKRFLIWWPSAILNFRNLDFITTLYRHVILLPCAKFHWNWIIGCWVIAKNRCSKWRPSAILNFLNFHIWSCQCQRVSTLHLCTKVHQNRMNCHWDMAFWQFFKMVDLRHLEFSEFRLSVMYLLLPCYYASLCKISLKSDNWLLNYGQKTIFNVTDVNHLGF